MGTSLSLALFAALVAAIAVVASLTVLGAVFVMVYSGGSEEEVPPEAEFYPLPKVPLPRSTPRPASRHVPLEVTAIDARKLVGFFDEEDSSIARFDPMGGGLPPAFGTPEWTEEEGATEIFTTLPTAAEGSAEFQFAEFDELPTRIASVAKG